MLGLDDTVAETIISNVVTAIVTFAGTYFLGKRKLNAEIDTNKEKVAATIEDQVRQRLYEEADAYRRNLQKDVDTLRARCDGLESENRNYAVENAQLKSRLTEVEADLVILRKYIADKNHIDPELITASK